MAPALHEAVLKAFLRLRQCLPQHLFALLGAELSQFLAQLRPADWPESRRPAAPHCARPAAPMASVPTGMPAGICTVESSESMPFSDALSTGTPSTGSTVCAAHHARPGAPRRPPPR